MPWYDFQCESCGNVFELQRSMSDTGKAKCKNCGSTRTVKIYSAAGIQFKGGGFYATDSRSSVPSTSTGDSPAPATPETPVAPAEKPADKPAKGKPPVSEKASA